MIEVTHFGEDYAKVEITKGKKVYEYEVPKEIGHQVKRIERALERLVSSQATQLVETKK